MRFIKNGELQDKKIEAALREAADSYANGELIEVRDLLLEIVDAIDEFEGQSEEPCGTCEYNLEMLRKYHVMYLPDTCPRRSSGECPEGRNDG